MDKENIMTIKKAYEIAKDIEIRILRLKRNNGNLSDINLEVRKLEHASVELLRKLENIIEANNG